MVPLQDYNNERAAYAVLDKMFNKFEAPIEVFTNQGMEFQRDFQDLCEKALIDHWTSSWTQLEVDELAKQMVRMMKQGLQKYGFQKGRTQDWDL